MHISDSITVVACCYRIPATELVRRVRELVGTEPVAITGFVVSSLHKVKSDLGNGWTALPSDNIDFDFSAYFTGAYAASKLNSTDQVVLFINDTLFTDHAATANFRAAWRQRGLIRQIGLPAIAGKADKYTTICMRSPWSSLGVYVTSFCFVLNGPALKLMLRLREFAEDDNVTHEYDVDSAAWGSRLPGQFRSGDYSASQLRSKARAIYFEHRLSGEIAANGCLLPTNAGPRWGTYIAISDRFFRLRRQLGL